MTQIRLQDATPEHQRAYHGLQRASIWLDGARMRKDWVAYAAWYRRYDFYERELRKPMIASILAMKPMTQAAMQEWHWRPGFGDIGRDYSAP